MQSDGEAFLANNRAKDHSYLQLRSPKESELSVYCYSIQRLLTLLTGPAKAPAHQGSKESMPGSCDCSWRG